MDPRTLGVLIPIIALLIPVVAIVTRSMHRMALLRIEEAKIRAGGGAEEEVQQLRDDVEQLRGEMAEMQERMDFTERLLARNSDAERLPKPE